MKYPVHSVHFHFRVLNFIMTGTAKIFKIIFLKEKEKKSKKMGKKNENSKKSKDFYLQHFLGTCGQL